LGKLLPEPSPKIYQVSFKNICKNGDQDINKMDKVLDEIEHHLNNNKEYF
jgi:hypothetical protein